MVENLTVKQWIGMILLQAIPLVNIIALLIWAFKDNVNPIKKNYAKANLLIVGVFMIVYAIILAAILTAESVG